MPIFVLTVILLALIYVAYRSGRSRAVNQSGGSARGLHSLPYYYGYYVALWCGVPAVLLLAAWSIFQPEIVRALVIGDLPEHLRNVEPEKLSLLFNNIRNIAEGAALPRDDQDITAAVAHYKNLQTLASAAMAVLAIALAIAGAFYGRTRISPQLRARNAFERAMQWLLIASSLVAILTTIGIVFSLLFEAMRFFRAIPVTDFLFGLEWSPQTAIRADQVGASGSFGAVPLFAGTMLISLIAMIVAAPLGLLAAIYLSEYAKPRLRAIAKPALEILAGIPTVVYGFFAALTMAPFLRNSGNLMGLDISSESALAAGVVMGIMIIPFVSSISDDVITAVPQSLREGSYGMGATQSETIKKVIFPAALPGIVGGLLLAVSRAIGETMIVVMAAGLAANLTANPFQAVTTVTVQIVTLLIGDQEFDSPKTLAAFALGLVLFGITLVLNVVALSVVNRYREKYD
jgi:phosphate transport system permease protein